MYEAFRGPKGLGDSEVFVRIPYGGQYWDFVGLVWSSDESRVFMTEIADSSVDQSWYSCDITPPLTGEPYSLEIVQLSTGLPIGYDIITAGSSTSATGGGMTVADLLTSQLRLVGAVASGETPQDYELTDALQANNMMLASWSARKLLVRSLVQEHFTLVAGQASYTIGPGGNFNTGKPIAIPGAFLRVAGSDYPVDVVTESEFNSQADKSSPGMPAMLYFDPGQAQQGSQVGTVYLCNVPDQAYTLYIEQQKYLTALGNLSDAITFEPAYLRAIKFNGAVEYYYEYRKHSQLLPPDVRSIAKESLRIIENMNTTLLVCGFDLPGGGKGGFNIMTGGSD